MCTSVPHTPARRTRMRTSSSRIRGSATSLNLKPGDADSFTSAFTSGHSVESREKLPARGEFLTCSHRAAFGSYRHKGVGAKKYCTHISCILYSRRVTSSVCALVVAVSSLVTRVPVRTRCRCGTRRFHQGGGESSTSSWRDNMAAAKRRGRKGGAKKSGGRRSAAARSASARKGARTRARNKAAKAAARKKRR